MAAILGIDQFSLNGIPSDIDAMHQAFPFGWYQISNGMEVGIMVRKAWPVYAKYYGGYHYFNPNPNGNWLFQDWNTYAESCAWLFLNAMKDSLGNKNYGGCPPMIDVEGRISQNSINILFPNMSFAEQIRRRNALYFKMLKTICDIVEQETGQVPVLYTGYYFWLELGGQDQGWASRLPLMLAVYPFDNYINEADYLAAIAQVASGAATLPTIQIPKPWNSATYVQFTGRAPAAHIPGYAREANWAKTVDMSFQVIKEVHNDPDPVTNTYRCNGNLNVRFGPDQNTAYLGTLPLGTLVNIDQSQGQYSHFLPTIQYPQGGWLFTAYLGKVNP